MDTESNINKFTVLTYNIDKREYNMLERIVAFVNVIKVSMPDFVLLQETTKISLEKLVREIHLLGYKRYIPDNERQRTTLEVIFTKYPVKKSFYIEFRMSPERRGLTCINVSIHDKYNIWLVTSQFDKNSTLKKSQLTEMKPLLKKNGVDITDNVIFGGDTGIFEYQKDIGCPDEWLDAWYEAGTDKEKYTIDYEKNPYVLQPHKDRPDRIWFSDNKRILCENCEFFGEDSEIVISSHYGVLATFVLN